MRDYVARFNREALQIEDLVIPSTIEAMIRGVHSQGMFDFLRKVPPKKLAEFIDRAGRCLNKMMREK